MIRTALAAAALLTATQAQAGQDVPPPRPIRPVQPVLAYAAPAQAGPLGWRETPAVIERWPPDRHVPVVGHDMMTACEARARMGAMISSDWADEGDDFAMFDDQDIGADWEMMQ